MSLTFVELFLELSFSLFCLSVCGISLYFHYVCYVCQLCMYVCVFVCLCLCPSTLTFSQTLIKLPLCLPSRLLLSFSLSAGLSWSLPLTPTLPNPPPPVRSSGNLILDTIDQQLPFPELTPRPRGHVPTVVCDFSRCRTTRENPSINFSISFIRSARTSVFISNTHH